MVRNEKRTEAALIGRLGSCDDDSWRLGEHGAMEIVATNTISQSDTRRTGLAAMLRGGFTISSADPDLECMGEARQ